MRKTFFLMVIAAGVVAAADVSGKWAGTMETNGRPVRIFVTLNQHGDQVTGSVATGSDAASVPIENPRIQGDVLTFDVHDNAGRARSFQLSLNGTALSGESKVGQEMARIALARSAYRVGGGVSAPMVIYKKDPDYSEEARKAKFQGTVLLSAEIDPTGTATNIKVVRSLGLGLDEKAIQAVQQWKFKPGMKDGEPVTVAATIEVNFRL
jgi:TonB family protein